MTTREIIYEIIKRRKRVTRDQIMKQTGLSYSCVNDRLMELVGDRKIYATGYVRSRVRKALVYGVLTLGKRYVPFDDRQFSSDETDYGTNPKLPTYKWSKVADEAKTIGYVAGDYLTRLPLAVKEN